MILYRSCHVAENYLTAYQALVWNARLKDGETILIHAVSSVISCTVEPLLTATPE